MNYLFDTENISQHIVKYGVDVRPPIVPEQEKTKLQDYCNWLIEQFPETYETLLSGPKQLQVQKTFELTASKRAQIPTFILTPRGPVFTFPQRMYLDQVNDLDIAQHDKIFRKALDELRTIFADRKVPRVGVVNEFVFDTGQMNSLNIIASNLKSDLWRQRANNLRIIIEIPIEDKNINLEIKPTYLRRTGSGDISNEDMRYGIIVNVDINNRQIKESLTRAEITDICTFADDYIPDELIKFLNNEY